MARKLKFKIHQSIDGFIGTPQGGVEWVFANYDDAMTQHEVANLWDAGVHIMGRALYEDMAAFWPNSTESFAPPMNDIPKLVFSSTVKTSDWKGVSFTDGDLVTEIEKLKAQDGKPIRAHGGARFARALSKHGLIDEYHLYVHPIALGEGLPIFCDQVKLACVETRQFDTGVTFIKFIKK